MGKFRISRCLAAVVLLAGAASAFMPMYCPGGTHRGCEDAEDSATAAKLPDSLRITLQQKLESDTGLVFWGLQKHMEPLAHIMYPRGTERRWTHDSITGEQEHMFSVWYNEQKEAARVRLDSVPEDLKRAYIDAIGNNIYALVRAEYTIKKIYDRQTRSWIEPGESASTFTRYILVHLGPVVETKPPRLLGDYILDYVDPREERIFFEDGHSRIINEDDFNSIDSLLKKDGYYLPLRYNLEISKNMSPIYKQRIMEALGAGDRDAIRQNTAALDSFLVYASERFFYSPHPSPLNCGTKQLMNAYLRTFEDGLDCVSDYHDMNEVERTIYSMLKDSLIAMSRSGELEKSISTLSSGDRSFWRALASAYSTTDQDELNHIVEQNVDSIKKIEQRNFITERFYRGFGVRWTVQMGMGGGATFGLNDTHHYIENPFTFDFLLEFFGKKYGGGYNGRIFASEKFDDDKYLSIYLLDIYAGYRTFSTSHVENFIFAGPTILFSDLMQKDNQDPLKFHVGVGFHFGTAFDFYFTKYKKDGQLRLGLRLFASISNYYTDVVKECDGGTLSVTLTPLMQAYTAHGTKYGEK